MRLHQRIRRERGHHTDDWLMTYADTITLLLCLFVVILSIKTHEHTTAPEIRPVAPETFFSFPPPMTEPAPETAAPDPAPWLVSTPEEPVVPPLRTEPPAVVDRLQTISPEVVEQHGDRITTIEINSAAFFASGNAALSGSGQEILRDVAVTLKSPDYAAYRFSIEGHTDDTPISTARFKSNWELSTARAAAVVRFLLEQGIPARQLTAAGYADTFPVVPNRNVDGTINPAGQARNRRVVIRLEKIDKAER